MLIQKTIFSVDKADINQTCISESKLDVSLLEGQVLLAVEQFSFTANNITYATLGESLRYWNFFPNHDGSGVIPVWGFAKVIASSHEGVALGQRFYGYYPMASHLIVEPAKVSPYGFVDATHHRKNLPVIYNQYTNTALDALYRQDAEALQMLMRPLFTTAFLLEDYFREQAYFNAQQVILTSASSKTAMGTALLLQANKKTCDSACQVVGLTSEANKAFVQSLGCYDVVMSYNELDQLAEQLSSAIIDFAGNGALLTQLVNLMPAKILHISLVGVSHWDQRQGLEPPAQGPKPVLFFAPSQAEKRLAQWTPAGFVQRLSIAWAQFETFSKPWLAIESHHGSEACAKIYQQVLTAGGAPNRGFILSLAHVESFGG